MFCSKCGNQVPDNSTFCNSCGSAVGVAVTSVSPPAPSVLPPVVEQKRKKPRKTGRVIAGLVLGFFALIVIIAVASQGSSDSKEPATNANGQAVTTTTKAPPTEPETIKISATQLVSEYNANGVKADQQYKGKLLEVTGEVLSVDTGVWDSVYVVLDSGEPFGHSVQCFFADKDEISKTAELSKGEVVTIVGKCDGVALFNVDIRQSKLK